MAAKHFYRQGFLLLLFNFISTAVFEKRFSDFKRCADEECSMLLCRGKAVKDFSGPDCRFLSFKKSETVYVYYKLSGRRADIWAGSVGSHFGYFPKDLLAVNHLYTDKELEIPAEETDFVCFDTGYDKFDNYDVDLLLDLSVKKNDIENIGTSDQIQGPEGTQKETQPSEEEASKSEEHTEHHDKSEDLNKVDDKAVEAHTAATPDATERATEEQEEEEVEQKHEPQSIPEMMPEMSETKDTPTTPEVEYVPVDDVSEKESVLVSEGVQIPEVKTTLGTTFDAVITEEEITNKVTPYEDDDSEELENPPEDVIDVEEETPLLSFSEETVNTLASDSLKKEETLPTTQDDIPKTSEEEEKTMWTSLGDAVFSVVTGGEMTSQDLDVEEDDDDEEEEEEEEQEEESPAKTPQGFEEAQREPLPKEIQKEFKNIQQVFQDPSHPSSVQSDAEISDSQSDKLLFDNENDGEVIGHEEAWDETLKLTDELIHHQTTVNVVSVDPESQDDTLGSPESEKSDGKTTQEPTEDIEGMSMDSEVKEDNANTQNSRVAIEQDLDNALDENRKSINQELAIENKEDQDLLTEERNSDPSEVKDGENIADDSLPNEIHKHSMAFSESNNSQTELPIEKPEVHEEPHAGKREDEKAVAMEEEGEELLEDENALFFSQSDTSPETSLPTVSTPEIQYSDSVMRLSLLREHFTEEKMERVQKLLGLKNLFKLEAMFSDLDTELQATRLTHAGTTQDIEIALEGIFEASENAILDETEKMLDSPDRKRNYDEHMDTSSLDEETEILDDFQELAFSLRQKYSTASDSTPLATGKPSEFEQDKHELDGKEDTPPIVEEKFDSIPETASENNLTVTDHEERPTEIQEEPVVLDKVPTGLDISVEEDGGHFNKNKDNQPGFSDSHEMQKVSQAPLEHPLEIGLGVEVEHSPSGSMDSMEPVSEMSEEEVGLFSTGIVYTACILSVIKNKTSEWTILMISLLPEEWKPGETLFGCPWQAVVITALVGVVTFILFFWRTVLAVKKREYLVDEKGLTEQIQALKKEKNDALAKMSELQRQTDQLKENQKQSKETVSCTMKRMQDLESKVLEAETLNEHMAEEKNKYAKQLKEEQANSLQNETRIEKLEKSNEKLQLSWKKVQEALTKTTVLLDEAKIRENARNVQHKCREKDFAALKDENKTLKATIKDWEDKHMELNDKIKVYQKSQKELEDSVVLKDHNVEVLSELLADLDACDLQKGDTKVLANGEVAPDKKTAIKSRIKQMMDVSRVQTTLTVVEDERDRFMAKLLHEEKSRKALEEQHQELEHAIATLKSEKGHVENQFKILQQKNEIMVEMYQQKENALQQKLTKEELERRSKESLLSEVGGKAVEAEEQVKVLRQRINEMEDQMKKTEEVYKEQIKEQENKTHSNWVNARNAERALNQEKLESSKLREKLAILTSQLNERRAPLFRPNSGQPAGPCQGDSYGPSPVSGGAPSPPLMIEGPRRPPSAPIGRRIDPYGQRSPSEPHSRYPENKHIPGMDMMGPRSSSPANLDGTGPGSFIASPIRDSPGPIVQGPPPGPGPHNPLLPPGAHGRVPPPGPYRPPRPGLYHLPPGPAPPNVLPPLHGPPLPANGHPGMPLAGPVGGEFGPRPANGHTFHPRPGPVHDPRGPLPPHFRPPPPHYFGPMPSPHGIRGPVGLRPPIPPDMRFPGSRDHTSPPLNLPPGVHPHPVHPGDVYGQAAPNALQNSAGTHNVLGQDVHAEQEALQDSARPAVAKP
ncbi:melanoma inhibitory activity protein 3 isoform X2 [Stegastes partitus]|uniref:Transport and Golgi organization protein 1 homolog n=1 Tax=Stegastes partitus TaxID=144197 RepID=A0A3B5AK33_9TELE|nr:PREDICTED: melanoma inhibitory activity protein 3 isoform X2 [Stegastes partitus]